jgi:hypothetical protein
VVFVNDVVAVHHVFPKVRTKPGNHPYRLAFTQVEDILPTPFVGKRGSAVAIEHLQIDEMNVYGMNPATSGVNQIPNLYIAKAGFPSTRFLSHTLLLIFHCPPLRSNRNVRDRTAEDTGIGSTKRNLSGIELSSLS